MSRLFGKDGMRGLAVTELTCELAMETGRAAAMVLANPKAGKTKIIVGKDCRNSSDTLEAALCAGICSAGADAVLAGVVPTSALAWQIKEQNVHGGIMITASHVNSEFNGLKLFSAQGYRLDSDKEEEIERLILDNPEELLPIPRRVYGGVSRLENVLDGYVARIKEAAGCDLTGLKIAVDCANGCASKTAGEIFAGTGAELVFMGNDPDGTNINSSGSTHIDQLMEFVTENKCDCGIAFDGGAERCLAVDEKGCLVDGDVIIAACADEMKRTDALKHGIITVTQANNLGLLQFARSHGIGTSAAPTGERSMVRRMLECGFSLGGDPTGHILFLDDMPTADGQLTGLRLLNVLKKSERPMSKLAEIIEKSPQVMLNVPISKKFREVWKNDRAITGIIDEFEEILGEEGRVVVREIGKDPVIRIRIEGKDFSTINTMALQIADTIKERMELREQ
ncbi:MAG: phosphoglucosamine mutase [Alistipes sp.]|nr:phosphoglucosamine mutase [Alistipes sp.]